MNRNNNVIRIASILGIVKLVLLFVSIFDLPVSQYLYRKASSGPFSFFFEEYKIFNFTFGLLDEVGLMVLAFVFALIFAKKTQDEKIFRFQLYFSLGMILIFLLMHFTKHINEMHPSGFAILLSLIVGFMFSYKFSMNPRAGFLEVARKVYGIFLYCAFLIGFVYGTPYFIFSVSVLLIIGLLPFFMGFFFGRLE